MRYVDAVAPYPMPGTSLDGATVVASAFYVDTVEDGEEDRCEVLVLRLHPEAPYFSVDLYDLLTPAPTLIEQWARERNLCTAAELYGQVGSE